MSWKRFLDDELASTLCTIALILAAIAVIAEAGDKLLR